MNKILILSCILATSLFSFDDKELSIYRDSVSNMYSHLLNNITSFMYDKDQDNFEYIKKHNKLRLYLNNSIDEDGKINSSVALRASLKLPRLSKNLYLSVDKQTEDVTLSNNQKSSLEKEKQSSRVGLKYFFLREKDREVFAKLGGRINLHGNKIYFKIGANRLKKYHDIYTFLYLNEYYYIKNSEFKTETGVDFKKILDKTFTLSQNNSFTIENSTTYLSNTILLSQYLNSKEMLTYWTTLNSSYSHHDFTKESISLNLGYHRMLKKWIFVDVIPSIVKELRDKKETKKYLQVNFGFIF